MKQTISAVLAIAACELASAQNATFTCDQASWNALAGQATQVESFSSFTSDADFFFSSQALGFGSMGITSGGPYIGSNLIDVYLFEPVPVGGGYVGDDGTTHALCLLRKSATIPPTEITLHFAQPTSAFGAKLWIAMAGSSGALEYEAFDGNVSLGAGALFANCSTLCNGAGCPPTVFFGVVVPPPQSFDRIVIREHPSAAPTSHIPFVMDDLSVVDAICTAPTTYCTSSTSANGCAATISSTGVASASAISGFQVRANGIVGLHNGCFFYGLSGATAVPWAVGSTSFKCVAAPTQRTPLQNSGGASAQCDGVLQLDWNAFVNSTPTALGYASPAGQRVWMQAWFRDGGAPKGSNLSNGLTFQLCP
jgi:hypothetical protein